MKHFLSSLMLFAALFTGAEEQVKKTEKAPEPVKAVVAGTSLNVRAAANTRSEVLCQIGKDQEVTVFEVKDNWARIQAPESSIVWILSENLKDGVVESECSIYAGPAILYSVVGKLKKGAAIKVVRGSEKWMQIVPPKGISAWVSAKYLEFPEIVVHRPADKIVKEKDEQPVEVVKDKDELAAKVSELKDNREVIASLDPGDKQYYFDKKIVAEKGQHLVTGTITELKKPVENLATHALVVKVDKKYYTVCYLRSSTYKLDEWLGKRVAVQGKQELIAGWQRPVIIASSIRPILGNPTVKMREQKQ